MGGMILSTFVNLVLVPVIYVLVVNIREAGRGKKRGGGSGPDRSRGSVQASAVEAVPSASRP
jgi:hypothetical protein